MNSSKPNSYWLFLDDERFPEDVSWIELPSKEASDWVIVRNHDQFVDTVMKLGCPAVVSFDHDLHDEHYPTDDNSIDRVIIYQQFEKPTGYHSAVWLAGYCSARELLPPVSFVHSKNRAGSANIQRVMQQASTNWHNRNEEI